MTTLGFATMANQPQEKPKPKSKRERQAANNAGQINITKQIFEAVSTKQDQIITDPCFGHEKRVYTNEEESNAKRIIKDELCNRHGRFFTMSSCVNPHTTRFTAGKCNGQMECRACKTAVPQTVATGHLRDKEGNLIYDKETGFYETGPIMKSGRGGKSKRLLVHGRKGNYSAICQGPRGQGCGQELVYTQYTVRSSDGKTYTFDTNCYGKGHGVILDTWVDTEIVAMCPEQFETRHPYFPGAAIDPNSHGKPKTLGRWLTDNCSEQLEARRAKFEQKRPAKKEDDGFTTVKTRQAKKKGQKMLCTTDDCSFVCWTSFQGPPSTFKCNRCRGVKPRSKSTK